MMSQWNPELARFFKSFLFDAGLFIGLLTTLVVCSRHLKKLRWHLALFTLALGAYVSPLPNRLLGDWLQQASEHLVAINNSNCDSPSRRLVVLAAGFMGEKLPDLHFQLRLLRATEWIHSQGNADWVVSGIPTSISRDQVIPALSRFSGMNHFGYEGESTNTHENATFTRRYFEERNWDPGIVLVTSDYHMRRAYGAFVRAGFQVCVAPAQTPVAHDSRLFSFSHGERTSLLLNEIIGWVFYLVRDWV